MAAFGSAGMLTDRYSTPRRPWRNRAVSPQGAEPRLELLHRACVEVEGGRIGRARAVDGTGAVFDLAPPAGPGGTARGTNPEQLFAAACGASFGCALDLEARQLGIVLGGCAVTASVALGHADDGRFALSVALEVRLPGLDPATARRLVQAAQTECPYSRMARGGAGIRIVLAEPRDAGAQQDS